MKKSDTEYSINQANKYLENIDVSQDEAKQSSHTSSQRSSRVHSQGSQSSTSVPGNPDDLYSSRSIVSPTSGRYTTTQERGRTVIGPQAEHTTARVMYSRLVDQAIKTGGTISKSREAFKQYFECLPISSTDLQEIYKIIDDCDAKMTQYKRERHNIKKFEGRTDAGFDPQIVNEVMVLGIQSLNSKALGLLIDRAVFSSNKIPHASFPTEGIANNPNTGYEQSAKNRLALLSDVITGVAKINILRTDATEESQNNLQNNLQKELAKFRKNFTEQKQCNLEQHWGINSDQVEQLLSGDLPIDNIFHNIRDNISKYMGQLFYYPKFDISEENKETTIDGIKGDWAITQQEWNEVMAREGTQAKIQGKRPKYNKGTLPRNNDPEIMYEVAGRHIAWVFNCFRGLSEFNSENQEEIVYNFLENSILSGKNSWCDEIDPKSQQKIDADLLNKKIREDNILDHENRVFAAKDSIMFQELSQSQQMSRSRNS